MENIAILNMQAFNVFLYVLILMPGFVPCRFKFVWINLNTFFE